MRGLGQVLAVISLVLHTACGGGSSTRPSPGPLLPPQPLIPRLVGTLTTTSELTEAGGFRYQHRVELSETVGGSGTVRLVEFAYFTGDAFYGGSTFDEPNAWSNGTGAFTGNGTLSSRPLVVSDPDPTDYADHVEARVVYTNGTTERELFLSADGPPMPTPPAGTVLTLTGTARDASSKATVRDVRVEITSGPGAGKNTKTDRNGKYTLKGAGAGTVTVKASKSGYEPVTETMLLLSAKTKDFTLTKTSSSTGATAPLSATASSTPKRLQGAVR